MFTLIAYLTRVFLERKTKQNELDQFITSKNPTTPAEVDYWSREFDRRQVGSWL